MSGILLIVYFIILSISFFVLSVGLHRYFRFKLEGDKSHVITFGFVILFLLAVFISLSFISQAEWSFVLPKLN